MQFVEVERERFADDGDPPLSWERYLEVAPVLTGLDSDARDEELAARGIGAATWTRAESYWLLTLALDVHRGSTDRANAFGQACSAQRVEGGDKRRTTDVAASEGQSQPDPGPSTPGQPAPPAAVVPLAPPPAVAAVPTFLQPRAQPPAMPAPFAPLSSVPVAVPAPVITSATSAPATTRARSFANVTLEGDSPVHGAVVPFAKPKAADHAAPPAIPSGPPRKRAPDPFGGTMEGTATSGGPATPFERSAPPRKPATRLPELTVVQHAMLSAELSIGGGAAHRTEVLARYGVDGADGLTRLGAEWQSRLQSDPRLASQWRDVYARHQASLRGQKR